MRLIGGCPGKSKHCAACASDGVRVLLHTEGSSQRRGNSRGMGGRQVYFNKGTGNARKPSTGGDLELRAKGDGE